MATAPPYRPPGSAGGRYLVRRVRTGSSPARDPGEPGVGSIELLPAWLLARL